MKNSALALKSKGKHPEKSKVVVPQVVTDNEKLLPALTMEPKPNRNPLGTA